MYKNLHRILCGFSTCHRRAHDVSYSSFYCWDLLTIITSLYANIAELFWDESSFGILFLIVPHRLSFRHLSYQFSFWYHYDTNFYFLLVRRIKWGIYFVGSLCDTQTKKITCWLCQVWRSGQYMGRFWVI